MQKKDNQLRIFVSYSWSNTDIADQIEKDLSQFQIELERDVRDIKYKSSIKEFMARIRDAKYALVLISDEYLKSTNCMIEVLHLLKEKNYEDKILPIIVGKPQIYNTEGRLQYTKYWHSKRHELEKLISDIPPSSIINEISELKNIESISSNINEFIGYISSIKNIDFDELKKEGYRSILEKIGLKDVSHLISLLIISFVRDIQKKDIMLDEWLETYKPTTDSYTIKAGIARDKHDYVKAEINFKKALELEPSNAFALNNYGYMLMCLGKDHEKARDMFTRAVKIMPYLTEARLNLGCLLTDKFNAKQEAKAQYEKIISYNPTEERAYNNLANLIKGSDSHDKIKQKMVCDLYEKAITLNPKYIGAHLGYGNYLSEVVHDFEKAEKVFDAMSDIDPESQELVETLKKRNSQIKEREFYNNVPRNAHCPCGSGKKYKNCHLLKR